jgi:hypothetical protein
MKANYIKTVILMTILSIGQVSAQSKLKFNEIIIIGNSIKTVPVGKVWKVENFITIPDVETNVDCKEDEDIASMASVIIVNKKTIYLNHQSATLPQHTHTLLMGNGDDIYNLKAGTTVCTYCTGTRLTVLEFDEVK